ncbi:hypothetical protein GTA08_BOTSDO12165 [Botryosphaeria dothidea]|uniref:Uncharacterized protein n=1 Tax=Botryosphaeria dothidea TaxID=55169 RepID=A0A8H4J2I6_9PEZI|nr:hypothetical protein GTA08_BOTSDO12165 [Botryosphaeria dothidea]
MIPQMPFRFFGSLEGSFLTAAEPTSYAYSPHSSVYSSSTTLYEERGPRIIEPQPPAREASSEHDKAAATSQAAAEPTSKQGVDAAESTTSSEPSSRSSSRSSSPKRPIGVDLLCSAPRMNATRMVG